MTWLVEDPWPIIWLSLGVLGLLGVGYYNSRHKAVLGAIVVVLLLAAACLVVEQLVVTEREEVEQTINDAAAAVKQNNLQAVLSFIDPEAQSMRASVQSILPLFQVVDAKVTGNLKTEIRQTAGGPQATANFVGKISVRSDSSQILTHENYVRPFTVQLRKQDGRWLMTGYETDYVPRGAR